tara:strand:+ start:1212 stop:1490 length:279 start_codon:yes stop_codon:yes gene_type:complete
MQNDGTLKNKISELNDETDRYVIAMGKLSNDGETIDYNISTWKFPVADLPVAAKKIVRLIHQQHETESKKMLMSSDEKEAYRIQEQLKEQLS